MLVIHLADGTLEEFSNCYTFITNNGDLNVIEENRVKNKTVACFAAGIWSKVVVL